MNRSLRSLIPVCAFLLVMDSTAQSDGCAGATLLSCGANVSGNTTAYTADLAPVCTTTNGTGGGVWYRFVGTGNSITASLCGSSFDTKIRVYTGACGSLVCTIGNDDFCGLRSQVTWVSTLGTTYYILVHGFGSAVGAYNLTIACAAAPVPLCYMAASVPYTADPYTGTALTLTDDVHSAAIPIGFSFCYNGNSYTHCVVSSNNYVSFNTASAGLYSPWSTVAMPSATPVEVGNSILNPWQDIDPGIGGTITYQTLGVAPNRRFVVSYLNVPMFSCTTQFYTSQTILYEGSNCLASTILSKPLCTTWNNGNAVHALNNAGGTSSLVFAGRNNSQWTATSQGMFFVPTCAPCSTAATAACLNAVLPIELLHFRGHNNGTMNVLEWATASEQNSDRFIVERSADGEHFLPLLHTAAAGQSNTLITYSLKDEDPIRGFNYYRLQSVDQDGRTTLSDIVAIEALHLAGLVIHPNPVTNASRYGLPPGTALPAHLLVRDPTGRVVRAITVEQAEGLLDLGGLGSGCYLLEMPVLGPASSVRFVLDQ